MFPIMLDIKDKKCVVIGGGKIALRKINLLLAANPDLTVVSPSVCAEIEELSKNNHLQLLLKEVEYEDYQDAFLIIAATNSPEVNEDIFRRAGDTKLVNVASNHSLGNFHIPAAFSRGKLQISVSTGGASPYLAKHIKNVIMNQFDTSYEDYLDFLFAARSLIKSIDATEKRKTELLQELLKDDYKNSLVIRSEFLKKLKNEKNQ